MPAQCVSLWIGDKLGPVERACIRSVLRQGHPFLLYCYEVPAGVPAEVDLADAASVIPETCVFRHRKGSVAPFSDWFRYELQSRGAGTWVDTDMYLLRPLDDERPYLFGEERPGIINNAVLRLPPRSELVEQLLRQFRGRLGQNMLANFLRRAGLGARRWGSTGPTALTAAALRTGVACHALPAATFYPMPWQRAGWIVDPELRLEDTVGEATVGIHLWNECIKGFKEERAPDGSFLARLQSEGG